MNVLFIVLAILTFVSMGFDTNLFVLWNIVPIVISAFSFHELDRKAIYKNSNFHMIISILLMHVYFHAIMYFDIGKAATGSSTSALEYIFFPIYSVCFGILVYFISKLFKLVSNKLKT